MLICIDESGSFVVPTGRPHRVSCVAALVLPSGREAAIVDSFRALCSSWHYRSEEVKGSRLSEEEMDQALEFLGSFDVLAEVIGVDLGEHTVIGMEKWRDSEADTFTSSLTPEHMPALVRQLEAARASWLRLPYQLAVQASLTVLLIEEILQLATLFYVLRTPAELGTFRWLIDAKDRKRTRSEQLWTSVLLPILQTSSLTRPSLLLSGADYSAFEPFRVRFSSASDADKEALSWLAKEKGSEVTASTSGIDIRKVIGESLEFGDSRLNLTLQLVDIVASAFSRACNGTLQERGWRRLSRLLIAKQTGRTRLVRFREAYKPSDTITEPMEVICRLRDSARSLFP